MNANDPQSMKDDVRTTVLPFTFLALFLKFILFLSSHFAIDQSNTIRLFMLDLALLLLLWLLSLLYLVLVNSYKL